MAPGLALLTENFPPALGGSSALFAQIYQRLPLPGAVVIAAREAGAASAESWGQARVVRTLDRMPTWGVAGWRGYRAMTRALRAESVGPDTVIHCGRALPEGLAARLWSARAGSPYVCWVHGEELGYAAQSRELTWWMRHVHRHAAALLANSDNSRRLLQQVGVPADRIHVVHPGVVATAPDADAVSGLRRRLVGPDGLLLLSVGRLERRKGHDLVIKALPAVRHRHPGLRYVVVGDGAERARLEALAAEVGVGDQVLFEGAVAADALPGYYAACDLFVLPNRAIGGDVEGFGMVFLEAASAGRAAIGGNSGGVPEAIAAGQTGTLVSGEDVGELERAIEALLSDPHRRAQMGELGRARVRAEFTWDSAARQVLAVHQAVAERRRG